jgi:GTP cyclohydrolase IA
MKKYIDDFDPGVLEKVEEKYSEIMELLRLKEVVDEVHLVETPKRVSKMFINELFHSCYEAPPDIKVFKDSNNTPVISSNITIKSICAHHFVPFYGKCSIYYIPDNNLITGLSKFSRLADYFSRRPQIQENLTKQIGEYLFEKLEPKELIVAIKAKHMCICHRGANEDNPVTETYWAKHKNSDIPGCEIGFDKIRYVLDTISYAG